MECLGSYASVVGGALHHAAPMLTPSLQNYVRVDLTGHVIGWPADILEKQVRTYTTTCEYTSYTVLQYLILFWRNPSIKNCLKGHWWRKRIVGSLHQYKWRWTSESTFFTYKLLLNFNCISQYVCSIKPYCYDTAAQVGSYIDDYFDSLIRYNAS